MYIHPPFETFLSRLIFWTDNLLIDYQFTFSLIQEDDNHYTAINFMASPEQANKNLDMSINASNNFNLNITWSVGSTGTFAWFFYSQFIVY